MDTTKEMIKRKMRTASFKLDFFIILFIKLNYKIITIVVFDGLL